jgi:hypothetical protein
VKKWEKKGTFPQCLWECKLVHVKTVWRHLKKLKLEWPYYPAIALLRVYLKKCKSGYNKGTCSPLFIAALFTIIKLRKHPRYPTTDELIKKMWCIYKCTEILFSHKEEWNSVVCR